MTFSEELLADAYAVPEAATASAASATPIAGEQRTSHEVPHFQKRGKPNASRSRREHRPSQARKDELLVRFIPLNQDTLHGVRRGSYRRGELLSLGIGAFAAVDTGLDVPGAAAIRILG